MSEVHSLDEKLINKYNRNGPRYTSYPTALEFSNSYGEEDFCQSIDTGSVQALSLYIHIPFCHKLCYYCGCNKIVTRHAFKADEYLDHLIKEIDYRAQQFTKRTISQIHLGGGTPTFLSDAQMQRLVTKLKSAFNVNQQVQMSIEIDPREVTLLQISHLVSLGFNRISIGVQDFNLDVQQAINRVQDENHIRGLVSHCRQLGVSAINLDLVYGLPLQTIEKFNNTLNKIIDINPDRISLFSYAHLPSRFPAQRKIKDHDLPEAQTKLALQQNANIALINAGYQHIGMDHFAKPEDELAKAQRSGKLHRNFQGYTTGQNLDLLGLGVSSISQVGASFAQNHKELNLYYREINKHNNAVDKGIQISNDDSIRGHVIKQLICNLQLTIEAVEQEFSIDFSLYFQKELSQLHPMIQDGLLTLDSKMISVTRIGRPLIRSICMTFDRYQAIKEKRKFSRII